MPKGNFCGNLAVNYDFLEVDDTVDHQMLQNYWAVDSILLAVDPPFWWWATKAHCQSAAVGSLWGWTDGRRDGRTNKTGIIFGIVLQT